MYASGHYIVTVDWGDWWLYLFVKGPYISIRGPGVVYALDPALGHRVDERGCVVSYDGLLGDEGRWGWSRLWTSRWLEV